MSKKSRGLSPYVFSEWNEAQLVIHKLVERIVIQFCYMQNAVRYFSYFAHHIIYQGILSFFTNIKKERKKIFWFLISIDPFVIQFVSIWSKIFDNNGSIDKINNSRFYGYRRDRLLCLKIWELISFWDERREKEIGFCFQST